jgi:hypothetical protein
MSPTRKVFIGAISLGMLLTLGYIFHSYSSEDATSLSQDSNQTLPLESEKLASQIDSNLKGDNKSDSLDSNSAPVTSARTSNAPNESEDILVPSTEGSTNQAMNEDLSSMIPPQMEEITEEVQRNSHSTPKSLMNFARNIVPHVQRALTVESYSESVFEYLTNCALDNEGTRLSESARASCYMNAFKISQRYPEKYKSKFDSLKSNLPDRIKSLVSDFVNEG